MKYLIRVCVIILILVILVLIFFYPKPSGRGGSCAGCKITKCSCLGYEKVDVSFGPWRSACFGIPYACSTKKSPKN